MIRALWTSAGGMEAQQMNLDVIANNLANVNTSGFKKSSLEFSEMMYDTSESPGASSFANFGIYVSSVMAAPSIDRADSFAIHHFVSEWRIAGSRRHAYGATSTAHARYASLVA